MNDDEYFKKWSRIASWITEDRLKREKGLKKFFE